MDPRYNIIALFPAILTELQKAQPDAGLVDTTRENYVAISRKDGLGIGFGSEWNKPDFLKVGGHTWNYDGFRLPYKGTYGSIFVNAGRGAQVIVKEIIRRLLPTWEPVYLEGLGLATNDKAYESGKQATFQRMLALGGKDYSYNGSKEPRVKFGSLLFRIDSPGNCTLDGHLYLKEEVVADIIKCLQEKHPEVVA